MSESDSSLSARMPDGLDSTEQLLNPFPWYETMRENNPVRYDESRKRWDVFRYDDVKRVLSEYVTFSSAGASDFDPTGSLGTVMVDANPPEHERLRGIVDEYFQSGNLRDLKPSIRSIVDEQLDQAPADGNDIEVISELTAPVTVLTISRLLGIPPDHWDMVRRWTGAMGGEPADEDDMVDIERTFGGIHTYFEDLIQKRQNTPQEDLISVIANTKDSDAPLSLPEQTSFCILLFLAGFATTTHAVGNALWTLAEQDLYTSLRKGDLDVRTTFDESLRYRGPVHSISGRRTTEEVELSGVTIPAAEQVTSWIGSANRDPRQFENPDEFDPNRKPNRHIAFGSGLHYCLGSPLAKLEGETILGGVLDRAETIEFDEDSIAPIGSPIAYGLDRLDMRFHS